MFTHLFQLFLVICTSGVVVAAILTHRADRREAEARADRAFTAALAYINRRAKLGYYDDNEQAMTEDFDKTYTQLISQ